jgi:hypothetical protein
MVMTAIGAFVFGLVVGFITYRTLVRTADKTAVTDLAAVVSAIGGGAVTKLYDPSGQPFAWYAVGLAIGIMAFFVAYGLMNSKEALAKVMSGDTLVAGAQEVRPGENVPHGGPRA